MRKQPEVTAQTRQNLIDAFWSLYCEKRIGQITVREIARKAGYNRGTFYEYFTDVHDLLSQLEDSLIPAENELPPTTAVDAALPLGAFLKWYERNGMYYSVLLGENGDPAFAQKLKTSVKPVILKLMTVKKQMDPVEMEYIAEYMVSSMIGILSYWFQNRKSMPAERLIAMMADIMKHGVMSRINP